MKRETDRSSNYGVQYHALRYSERLDAAEAVTSVGSKHDSHDSTTSEALNSLFHKSPQPAAPR